MANMIQNIILTTNEYKNEAETIAQSYGGLVLTSCSVQDMWAYKATAWNSHDEVSISSYSEVESDLLKTRAVSLKDNLPIGTYAATLPYSYYCMSEAEVLSCTAEILRADGNYVLVMSSTHSNGTTSALDAGKGASTSAIVKSIEKDLGVDLEVNSDSELNSILYKNGAGPLSGLLRMAYGAEKKI